MKRLPFHICHLLLAIALLTAAPLLPGCGTAPQRAYQTVATTEITVSAAMTAWGNYVKQFHPPASEELKVKAAYEKYQAAMIVVADAGKAVAEGTGSQARLDIVVQTAAASLKDLVNLIQAFGITIPR